MAKLYVDIQQHFRFSIKWRTAVENLKHDVLTSVSAQLSEGSPFTCPRIHLSEVPVVRVGVRVMVRPGPLWIPLGSEFFFAVWMTLDDPNPNPNTNPRTSGVVNPRDKWALGQPTMNPYFYQVALSFNRIENIQEAQLMLTTSRDAFRDHSGSPNMEPFDMLGMVSY